VAEIRLAALRLRPVVYAAPVASIGATLGLVVLAWYWSGRRFSRAWFNRVWWWAGYRGLYQIDWWWQRRGTNRWWLRGVAHG
jgi:hypothetical protein